MNPFKLLLYIIFTFLVGIVLVYSRAIINEMMEEQIEKQVVQ